MKITTIDKLAYLMKQAKEEGLPQPIVFLGAGASKTGGIPLAGEIAKDILEKYKDNPDVKKLSEDSKTYSKLMQCLTPYERNALLKGYINTAKINVTHIYLAQLVIEGYVDYVLTVNFDNLMLRAFALFNYFPATYDMAILKDLTTTSFKEKSVIYLHGQHHGLWLLNTDEEMKKVNEVIPPILNSIKNQRPWIFIGYSGQDPIFKHITKLGRFDNELFWVAYNKNKPSDSVCNELLDKPLMNSCIIEGYDADSFMLRLNSELNLQQPFILDKPFSSLQNSLSCIIDIDDIEHFKGVKERLEIAKKNVVKAIEQFELGKFELTKQLNEAINISIFKKQIIDQILRNNFNHKEIISFEDSAKSLNNKEIDILMGELLFNWGNNIYELANQDKDEKLFEQCIEIYKKAARLNPNDFSIYYNWGTAISDIARMKNDEKLYKESFEKFRKATELNPKFVDTFYNWGNALHDLAKLKMDEKLYEESFEKFKITTELNPTYNYAYSNWGLAIFELARLKNNEILYEQSFEKFNKAIVINHNEYFPLYNWGNALYELAYLKNDEKLYEQSIEKFKRAAELNPNNASIYSNWGMAIFEYANLKNDEILYRHSFEKFNQATLINPDGINTFYNWGSTILKLAKLKNDERLYAQSIEKLLKSKKLGGNVYNLACAYAGNNDKTKAFENLELSLKRKEINPKSVAEDEDWKKYLNDSDFKSILDKYK